MEWLTILAAILFGGIQIWTISQLYGLWKISAAIHDQQKMQLDVLKIHNNLLKSKYDSIIK